MKIAQPHDWQTSPISSDKVLVKLYEAYTYDEIQLIRRGLIPEVMEDKWFIYWKDNSLYFHRSWTGFCIYIVHFSIYDGGGRILSAEINTDRDVCSLSIAEHIKFIPYYIELFLLKRNPPYPLQDDSPLSVLKAWSNIGRALLS